MSPPLGTALHRKAELKGGGMGRGAQRGREQRFNLTL